MKENGYKEGDVRNNCFLCEYAKNAFLSYEYNPSMMIMYDEGCPYCHLCPLDWGEEECASLNGLYTTVDRYLRDNDIEMAIVIARKIANLPERKRGNKNGNNSLSTSSCE